MFKPYFYNKNSNNQIESITTSLSRTQLLACAILNKGTAFSKEEREAFSLNGLLPSHVETLETQIKRAYLQYSIYESAIDKFNYLWELQHINQTLFYDLVQTHLIEMLPIIYTPTIADAVKNYSNAYRYSEGLLIDYSQRGKIKSLFKAYSSDDIDIIIVTDGEGVLGIGDQGIGGLHICYGKTHVYTLCAGINPNRILKVQLDVGTNNENLRNNPLYIGLKQERLTGQAYDDFIDEFVLAVFEHFPHAILHWEDFGKTNARRILDKYRNKMATFNDDIQGTGIITLASILSAIKRLDQTLEDQRIIIFGAGSAGTGIADMIVLAMQKLGLTKQQACSRIFLIDYQGLLTSTTSSTSAQEPYVKNISLIKDWIVNNKEKIELIDVVKNLKPTILIGCSACADAFNETVVKTMADHVECPIIFPLSNPTSKAEATPKDLIHWTQGKVLIATGSPFSPVEFQDKTFHIFQNNNAYSFPGLVLGCLSIKAERITDDRLIAAAFSLAELSQAEDDFCAALLPSLSEIKTISYRVAKTVAFQAMNNSPTNIDQMIKHKQWEAKYYPYQFSLDNIR